MRKHLILKYLLTILTLVSIQTVTAAEDKLWAISFLTGQSFPSGEFSDYVNKDNVMGIELEFMQSRNLGVRAIYSTREFNIEPAIYPDETIKVDSVSLLAVVAYPFPKWFRVFALAGPTYFNSRGQEFIGLGKDGKDISWSAGAGFDINPMQNWAIRLQSIFSSAELGTHFLRTNYVDSSVGLAFRF